MANNPMYFEQSRYATHLARWFACFQREQVLVLFQEEINQDPRVNASKVYRFLGIDATHISDFAKKRANESYIPKSREQERLLRELGGAARAAGMGAGIELLRKTGLIEAIHRANRLDIRKLVPPMMADTRQQLAESLAGEMKELTTLLGKTELPWPAWHAVGHLLRR